MCAGGVFALLLALAPNSRAGTTQDAAHWLDRLHESATTQNEALAHLEARRAELVKHVPRMKELLDAVDLPVRRFALDWCLEYLPLDRDLADRVRRIRRGKDGDLGPFSSWLNRLLDREFGGTGTVVALLEEWLLEDSVELRAGSIVSTLATLDTLDPARVEERRVRLLQSRRPDVVANAAAWLWQRDFERYQSDVLRALIERPPRWLDLSTRRLLRRLGDAVAENQLADRVLACRAVTRVFAQASIHYLIVSTPAFAARGASPWDGPNGPAHQITRWIESDDRELRLAAIAAFAALGISTEEGVAELEALAQSAGPEADAAGSALAALEPELPAEAREQFLTLLQQNPPVPGFERALAHLWARLPDDLVGQIRGLLILSRQNEKPSFVAPDTLGWMLVASLGRPGIAALREIAEADPTGVDTELALELLRSVSLEDWLESVVVLADRWVSAHVLGQIVHARADVNVAARARTLFVAHAESARESLLYALAGDRLTAYDVIDLLERPEVQLRALARATLHDRNAWRDGTDPRHDAGALFRHALQVDRPSLLEPVLRAAARAPADVPQDRLLELLDHPEFSKLRAAWFGAAQAVLERAATPAFIEELVSRTIVDDDRGLFLGIGRRLDAEHLAPLAPQLRCWLEERPKGVDAIVEWLARLGKDEANARAILAYAAAREGSEEALRQVVRYFGTVASAHADLLAEEIESASGWRRTVAIRALAKATLDFAESWPRYRDWAEPGGDSELAVLVLRGIARAPAVTPRVQRQLRRWMEERIDAEPDQPDPRFEELKLAWLRHETDARALADIVGRSRERKWTLISDPELERAGIELRDLEQLPAGASVGADGSRAVAREPLEAIVERFSDPRNGRSVLQAAERGESALPMLESVWRDPTQPVLVRDRALDAASRIGLDRSVIAALCSLCDHQDPSLRFTALRALYRIAYSDRVVQQVEDLDARVAEVAEPLLEDPHEPVQGVAIRVLALDARHLPLLRARLDRNLAAGRRPRNELVESLADAGGVSVALLHWALSECPPNPSWYWFEALAPKEIAGDAEALELLAQSLAHSNERVRRTAQRWLQASELPEPVRRAGAERGLLEPVFDIRKLAAGTLQLLDPPAWTQRLEEEFAAFESEDSDPDGRRKAWRVISTQWNVEAHKERALAAIERLALTPTGGAFSLELALAIDDVSIRYDRSSARSPDLERIVAGLRSDAESTRAAAARLLENPYLRLGQAELTRLLDGCTRSGENELPAVLVRMVRGRPRSYLRELLVAEDAAVRLAAVRILAEVEYVSEEGRVRLSAIAIHDEGVLQEEALRLLERLESDDE